MTLDGIELANKYKIYESKLHSQHVNKFKNDADFLKILDSFDKIIQKNYSLIEKFLNANSGNWNSEAYVLIYETFTKYLIKERLIKKESTVSNPNINDSKILCTEVFHESFLIFYLSKHFVESMFNSLNFGIYKKFINNPEWIIYQSLVYSVFNETKKIIIFYQIYNNFSFNKKDFKKLKKIILESIEELVSKDVLNIKTTLQNNKTIKFVSFKNKNNFELDKKNYMYTLPSKIFCYSDKTYSINLHFSSLHKILNSNVNNANSIPTVSDFLFLKNLYNTKSYLSENLLILAVDRILVETNQTQDWFSNNWWRTELIEKLNKFHINSLKKNATESQKSIYFAKLNLQTKFNLYLIYSNIVSLYDSISELKNGFFFSYFLDFRTRIYSEGNFGPTNNKILRNILNYGSYSKKELSCIETEVGQTKSWSLIKKYIPTLEKILNTSLDEHRNFETAAIFWSLIELGKIEKTSLLENGKVPIEKFLIRGGEIFFSKKDFSEIEDQLTAIKVYQTLENLIKKNHNEKTIYYKDATASVLQHLLKILGKKDDNALIYCNLSDSDNWWDPYSIIIANYLNKNSWGTYNKFITRKIFKKMIMTFNYSAELYSNIDYVLTEIRKLEIFKNAQEEEKKEIIKIMVKIIIDFRNYLNRHYEIDIFYANKSSIMVENWTKEQKSIKTYDDTDVFLNYNKLSETRTNFKNTSGDRRTFTWHKPSDNYDSESTERALRANIIHTADAQYARLLLNKYQLIPVHDSFGIDIFRICQFIDDANMIFKIDLIKTQFVGLISLKLDSSSYSLTILF